METGVVATTVSIQYGKAVARKHKFAYRDAVVTVRARWTLRLVSAKVWGVSTAAERVVAIPNGQRCTRSGGAVVGSSVGYACVASTRVQLVAGSARRAV